MFYTYQQNNTWGRWINTASLREIVIIEADSIVDANQRAEHIGIYFDGVSSGRDCDCCGDRWREQYDEGNGTATPSVYSVPIPEDEIVFVDPDPVHTLSTAIIYYKDGRVGYHTA